MSNKSDAKSSHEPEKTTPLDASPFPNPLDSKSACNCEKSRCLKLYCECFSRNVLCGPTCNCRDCLNSTLNVI